MQTQILPGILIHGDRELLTQALANLIENAIRHTPAGTTIQIAVGIKGDHVSVAVTDTGPGIPAAELPQVFQRFYRGTNARDVSGSGLGMKSGEGCRRAPRRHDRSKEHQARLVDCPRHTHRKRFVDGMRTDRIYD